ncbi:MAG: flippase [Calditrichaeota bacterium]|nr:MAG: flippase [Calditrichota bacterium]
MFSFLRNLRNDLSKRRIVENFFSLSVLQGANYLLALIILPYLTRVLGAEKFGLVMFAQAFVYHFVVITDFGFNLSATRAISLARNDPRKLSEIYSAVMIIKLLLTLLCLAIMMIIVLNFQRFSKEWPVYFLSFGVVIGQVLFPLWFFQGMERMKYITVLNLLAKLIFTFSIFIFVSGPSDYLYVPFLNSLGVISGGIIAIVIVLRRFGITPRIPAFEILKNQFKNGWYIFTSQIAISLYTTANTFILGIFTNDTIVGYYAAVEKIIQAVKFLPNPLYQAIYPHCAVLAETSREKCMRFLRRVFQFTVGYGLIVWAGMFVLSEYIVVFFLGAEFFPAIPIFRIFSFLVMITPMAYLVFNVVLLSFKLDKYFSLIYLSGALLNFIFLFLFLILLGWEANGVALSNVLAQTAILTLGVLTLWKHQIHIGGKTVVK